MGVTTADYCNFLRVDSRSLCNVSSDSPDHPSMLVPLLAATLALPSTALLSPTSLNWIGNVLVVGVETPIGAAIAGFYRHLGLNVEEWDDSLGHSPLRLLVSKASYFNLVVGSTQSLSDKGWLPRVLSNQGRQYAWNDPQHGVLQAVLHDPVLIGATLKWAILRCSTYKIARIDEEVTPDTIAAPYKSRMVPDGRSLFDSFKTYLLVGGAGGLGIWMAYWMFQVGPHSSIIAIVLTCTARLSEWGPSCGSYISLRTSNTKPSPGSSAPLDVPEEPT
jgi:hypothetical protein